MIELLKEALKTIKFLKDYCESDDPGLEIGAPVIKKLEEAIKNGTWRGLTDEEIVGTTCECVDDGTFNMDCAKDFARAIECKLKEKNT